MTRGRPRTFLILTSLCLLALMLAGIPANAVLARGSGEDGFTFILAADMRHFTGSGTYNSCRYFRGATEAIATVGKGAFMLVIGDFDPAPDTQWTIAETLGADYVWYPVVGNHELPSRGSEAEPGANMTWLRSYDLDLRSRSGSLGSVNAGPDGCPETTYSFDYQNVHIVVLNEYCDATGDTATDGDISDALYDWLAADLAATDKPLIFVAGHEPAFPQPDALTGRVRHRGDSLDKYPSHRDRFWTLLAQHGVATYVAGHTHNFSAVRLDGIWQIDVGHARGLGDVGAPSTFVRVIVQGDDVTYEAYRAAADDPCTYTLTDRWPNDATVMVQVAPTATFLPTTPALGDTPWYRSPIASYALGVLAVALLLGSVLTVVIALRAGRRPPFSDRFNDR